MNKTTDFLFIADGEPTFLQMSLANKLKEHYIVEKSDIDVESLGQISAIPKLIVMDAEIFLKYSESRIYIDDFCIQNAVKIILVGDKLDIDEANLVSPNIIAECFVRPINNNEVAEELGELIRTIDENDIRKRILVVDDSPVFLRLISEWLEGEYNVNVCPSATAAFHMIEINKPDLILLDYEMPVCNGAQFLEMLHSDEAMSHIPVMFLTSKDDRATVQTLINLKPQGYILKTATMEKVLNTLREFFYKEMTK